MAQNHFFSVIVKQMPLYQSEYNIIINTGDKTNTLH